MNAAEKILDHLKEMDVPAGTPLVEENDTSRKMFIIRNGRARVYKNYLGHRVTLAILGPGEIFGEMSFIDAQPRSASVVALTNMKLTVVDGDSGVDDLDNLPDWVWVILKTVFRRFREADQRITVLQGVQDFKKKRVKQVVISSTIFLELIRFNRSLKLIFERDLAKRGFSVANDVLSELDSLLGRRSIGLKVFWRLMKEHDFVDSSKEEGESRVSISIPSIDAFTEYLASEVRRERYLVLSHTALAILGKIIGYTEAGTSPKEVQNSARVQQKALKLHTISMSETGIEQLVEFGFIQIDGNEIVFSPSLVRDVFVYQSVIKGFDRGEITID